MNKPIDGTNWELINAIGGDTPLGWTAIFNSASSINNTAMYNNVGLDATAFLNTQTGQIVIAYAGVDSLSALPFSGSLGYGARSTEHGARILCYRTRPENS